MTVATWQPGLCPRCRSASSVELGADERICLDCRYEWAPSRTFGPVTGVDAGTFDATVPVLAVVSDEPDLLPGHVVDGRLVDGGHHVRGTHPDDVPAHIAAARSRYVGVEVVLHDVGAPGVVTEITDDGYAVVTFDNGFYVFAMPDEFTVTDETVIADETVTAIATTDMTIAAQVLRAADRTLVVDGDTLRLALPPDGWIPDEPGIMLVVEHAAAYAVAIVAMTAGVAPSDLLSLADRLDEAAEAAKGADNP